ncbi:type 2 isopentenyl-diphosphate Delta-isomerase [Enterococcus sp. HY326]|uniref:type 2 isopentenyl-diphosphate Delta-isomerase n=1 Tax=Enterococcus sp. HY326 TaxID=2971265 RepID=UPI00223FA598|nr:type 2 isopentenyl-diphosphate Delta-isomerase [Enterococcus sp. HY326]
MNRKDEHVSLAKAFHKEHTNDFDAVRFLHHSLQGADVDQVNLATTVGPFALTCPFYINAMTGGSEKTGKINHDLGLIAKETGLMIASGSVSAAIKDETLWPTFTSLRESNPEGIVLANVGADADLEKAKKAVAGLKADGLQIHLNLPQELVMPEGDRHFEQWSASLQEIVHNLDVPVIVKEVGFGMSRETIAQLLELGVKNIDVAGQGGTSFTQIENARRPKRELAYLNNWGQSTVISLLEANEVVFPPDATLLASGGVRNAYDIFKALALGAQAVGISATILNSLLKDGVDKTIELLTSWQEELRLLFSLVGAKSLQELQQKQVILSGHPKEWAEARNIDLKKYSMR